MLRRLTAVTSLLVLLAVARPARAGDPNAGPFGIGIMLGAPTGVSLKYYLKSSDKAIDGGVGGNFAGAQGISVHADFLWHPRVLATEPAFDMPFYVGIGVRILDHDHGAGQTNMQIGPRIPVGLLFDFNSVPLDVFLEVALILEYRFAGDDPKHEGFGPDLNAAIGVRYYF